MNLTTYRAYTMAEAITAVKRDLGNDARILHTRTYKRGGLFGIGRRTIVEVTATTEPAPLPTAQTPARPVINRRPDPLPGTAAARKAYAEVEAKTATTTSGDVSSASSPARGLRANVQEPGMLSPEAVASRKIDLLAAIVEHQRNTSSSRENDSQSRVSGRDSSTSTAKPCLVIRPTTVTHPATSPKASASATAPSTANDSAVLERVDARDEQQRVAKRFVLKPHDAVGRDRNATSDRNLVPPVVSVDPSVVVDDVIDARGASAAERARLSEHAPAEPSDDMRAIRSMVGQILERQRAAVAPSSVRPMPQQLFDIYLELIGQDVSDEIADDIVREVQQSLSENDLQDAEVVRRAVRERLIAMIPASDTPTAAAPRDGRPRTIALIGPTGVGKTTTVAKLAATFKLRHGQRVGLVTSDTYRIAAVDQLRTYANIIGLPLKVVRAPSEMAEACHQLRDCDVILIDTAGRSQKDREKLDELGAFIDAADPHEVHLVLSSTASERVLLQEAESFGALRADRIILTKLDEAVSFGMLVNVMQRVGKQLSFLTTGQEVPEHLEAGSSDRLASLVLGGTVRS